MRAQPIGNYIVVEDLKEEIVSGSGLILSDKDASSMRYKQAVVLKAGTDVKFIKEGDKICYDKGRSFTMIIEEKTCTIILKDDVVVVL